MHKYLKDKEITEALNNMTVVCDTREQENAHITGYFDKSHIKFTSRALKTGDYSAMLEDITFENDVCIEKKNSLDEICGNLTVNRERFNDEFTRAKANNTKVFLLIENCTYTDILSHNYRSAMKPSSLLASLLAWQAKYNITIIFCTPKESGQIIYGILYYWLRESLINGNIK